MGGKLARCHPKLLCLHGFTGAPASWDAARRNLSPETDVDVPALLGHDDATIASTSFEDEVDRLAERLRRHGTSGCHVAGYSQGGRLALGLLVRHRELFARATLIGASPGLRSEQERARRRAQDERLATRLETEGLESFLAHWEALPLFASQRDLPEGRLAGQRRVRRQHQASGLARALRTLGLGRMPSYWDDLASLELPVHLLVGELDGKFRALADEMAALLPRATIDVVGGAGHNLLLEAPERLARALEAPVP